MGFRELNRRIKAVAQTGEITDAMRLVASSRLDAAVARYEKFRPYMDSVSEMAERFAGQVSHGLWPPSRGEGGLLIVVGAERGLAGAYHANVSGAAKDAAKGKTPAILAVGRKTRDYLRRKGLAVQRTWAGPTEGIRRTVRALTDAILNAGEDTALVFTRFESLAIQRAETRPLLPLTGQGPDERQELLIEPGEEAVASTVLRLYVEAALEGALRSALASEHAARTIAMTSASENARDMMDELVLEKHRIRQGQITRELIELMSGLDE